MRHAYKIFSLLLIFLFLCAVACSPDFTKGNSPNRPPVIASPGTLHVNEEDTLTTIIDVIDPESDNLRVWLTGMPPGARWDEPARTLSFTPDFIQGGTSWTVTITADDGAGRVSETFTVEVADTIAPPPPAIVENTVHGRTRLYRLSQKTDDYLENPVMAGRTFEALLSVPVGVTEPRSLPVEVRLHFFFGRPRDTSVGEAADRIILAPADPDNSAWFGYADTYDAGNPAVPAAGVVVNYTQRRVLHLLQWVLDRFPVADPNRMYASGGSMGGIGAAFLGFYYGRHFCFANDALGSVVMANLPESDGEGFYDPLWGKRGADLPTLWGVPVREALDGTWVALHVPEAADQFLWMKHGKDDWALWWPATIGKSGLTGRNLYGVLEDEHRGHYTIWDEGGHGSPDPVLGPFWWDAGWNPVLDETTFLRRDLAFPAFSHSALNGDPGDGGPNGNQPYDEVFGYGGRDGVPGDTGYNGDIAGALNRFLRWDSTGIVDTFDRLEIPLRLINNTYGDKGDPPPEPGYPTLGDQLPAGRTSTTVNVTPRRTQSFKLLPGDKITWTFGDESGEAVADQDGLVTVPLTVTTDWQNLVLRR